MLLLITNMKNLTTHSGRPSSSHYFVGTQGSDFFYLDPHQTQPALPLHEDANDYTDEEIGSCHTRRLRRINVEEMDPSMLIGFLIRDEVDWHRWRESVREFPGKAIIHVADKEPPQSGSSIEREGAIDEVETFDTEEDEM
jgi:cysteine protease ATG4